MPQDPQLETFADKLADRMVGVRKPHVKAVTTGVDGAGHVRVLFTIDGAPDVVAHLRRIGQEDLDG